MEFKGNDYLKKQQESQGQLKALVNSYNSQAQDVKKGVSDLLNGLKVEKEGNWFSDIVGVPFSLIEGAFKGITDAAAGVVQLGANFIGNAKEIFVHDGRFGDGIGGRLEEMLSDLSYTALQPIIDNATGTISGLYSMQDIINPFTDSEDVKNFSDKMSDLATDTKASILAGENKITGDIQLGFGDLNVTQGDMNKDTINEHQDKWVGDVNIWSAEANNWVKDKIIEKVNIPEQLMGFSETGNFINSTMESVGRLIPAVISTSYGIPPVAAQAYFFSSNFGGSYSEAIANGASLDEAYQYAITSAGIETAIESIGGIEIGKLIGSGSFKNVLSSMIAEGSEELITEATSAGVSGLIGGDTTNEDFWSRGMYAFLGGALSGGIMTSAGKFTTQGKVETLDKKLNKELESTQDIAKVQKSIQSNITSVMTKLNRKSFSNVENKIQMVESNPMLKELITYNEDTSKFELTEKGSQVTNNLKSFVSPKQGDIILDSSLYAISKKMSLNTNLNSNIDITTVEQVKAFDESKQKTINNIIKNGKDVVFFNGDTDVKGFYSNDVVYINSNLSSSDMINTTLAHELTHKIKKSNPKGYEKLVKELKGNEITFTTQEKNTYKEKDSNVNINEEQVAVAIEKVLGNEEVMNKVFTRKPKLLETMKSVFDNKSTKLEKAFVKYSKKASENKVNLSDSVFNERTNAQDNKVAYSLNTKEIKDKLEDVLTGKKRIDEEYEVLLEEDFSNIVVTENKLSFEYTLKDNGKSGREQLLEVLDEYGFENLSDKIPTDINSDDITTVKVDDIVIDFAYDTIAIEMDKPKQGYFQQVAYEKSLNTYKKVKSKLIKGFFYKGYQVLSSRGATTITTNWKDKSEMHYESTQKAIRDIDNNTKGVEAFKKPKEENLNYTDARTKSLMENKLFRDTSGGYHYKGYSFKKQFKKYDIEHSQVLYENVFTWGNLDTKPTTVKNSLKEINSQPTVEQLATDLEYAIDNTMDENRLDSLKEEVKFDDKTSLYKGFNVKVNEDNTVRLTDSQGVLHKTIFKNKYLAKQYIDNIYDEAIDIRTKKVEEALYQKDVEQQSYIPAEEYNDVEYIGEKDLYIDEKLIKEWYDTNSANFNSIDYNQNNLENQLKFEAIKADNFKENKQSLGVVKRWESILDKADTRARKDNAYDNHAVKHIIQTMQLLMNRDSMYTEVKFGDNGKFKDRIEIAQDVIKSTLENSVYVDNVFSNNPNYYNAEYNPNGYQYFNKFYNQLREGKVPTELKNLAVAFASIDINDKRSISAVDKALHKLLDATTQFKVNSLNLKDESINDKFIHSVSNQHGDLLSNFKKIIGTNTKDANGKTVRQDAIVKFKIPKAARPILDSYAFGNIANGFIKNSTTNKLTSKIVESEIKKKEVMNIQNDFWEADGYLKKNRKSIANLEKETVVIKNLKNEFDNNDVVLPLSQVITLRNNILREVIRDGLITNSKRTGKLSSKFIDGNYVDIHDNTNDKLKNVKNKRTVQITNRTNLFNELNAIINNNSFLTEYNNKLLSYYANLYHYENDTKKDMEGLELMNDSYIFNHVDMDLKKEILNGLEVDDVDLENGLHIYVPLNVEYNKDRFSGADLISRINRDVADGMVQSIEFNSNKAIIKSSNEVLGTYTNSVSNYYAFSRIVTDMNELFERTIPTRNVDYNQTVSTLLNDIDPSIAKFYTSLLNNVTGFDTERGLTSQKLDKAYNSIKRNFYKATLGLNMKSIANQYASAWNLIGVFGGFSSNRARFTRIFMKKLVTKANQDYKAWMLENSAIMKDRMANNNYEISQGTKRDIIHNKLNDITELTMKGMSGTDNKINLAFFETLVEEQMHKGVPEIEAMNIALKKTEEGILRYQSSTFKTSQGELLRSTNLLAQTFSLFMGEPTKVLSNMTESYKNLEAIREYTKHKDEIWAKLDSEVESIQKQIEELEYDLGVNDEVEIENDIESELERAQALLERTIASNELFKQQIEEVINSKEAVKKEFVNRTVALAMSYSWQVLIATIFGAMRDREKASDETMFEYLAKMTGQQLLSQLIGYVPFARDLYDTLISGYDFNQVDVLGNMSNFASLFSDIIKDIANGGDFDLKGNTYEFIKNLSLIFGIPFRNLERFITTPMNLFFKSSGYQYRVATGQSTSSIELDNAVASGDDKLIETIIETNASKKGVVLTSKVLDEISYLKSSGYTVSLSAINDTFSIDGTVYQNNKKQYADVYNNATYVVEKIINNSQYDRLDNKQKASMVSAIFKYYNNLAKQTVSGVEIYPKSRTYNLTQAYNYFKSQFSYYRNKK